MGTDLNYANLILFIQTLVNILTSCSLNNVKVAARVLHLSVRIYKGIL